MKLESLKSSKFEAFKGSEVEKLGFIVGGQRVEMSSRTSDKCVDNAEKTCPNEGDAKWDDIKWNCPEMSTRDFSQDELDSFMMDVNKFL